MPAPTWRENAIIASWAIGIDAVYIYLRDEYHGCRAVLEREIAALQANAPCTIPELHLRRGAGAYICGEESAMINSIEGKRGEPRSRRPKRGGAPMTAIELVRVLRAASRPSRS